MPPTQLDDADALGADAYATQNSGKRWEPPSIHRMNLTQSEGGINENKKETTSSGISI